jgi:hypothetical protein
MDDTTRNNAERSNDGVVGVRVKISGHVRDHSFKVISLIVSYCDVAFVISQHSLDRCFQTFLDGFRQQFKKKKLLT